MGLLLSLASLYVPPPVRKRRLDMLFGATAGAFRAEIPPTRGLSCEECLERYAAFTREQAERCLLQGTQSEVRPRLFGNAHHLAQQLKHDLRIDASDVMCAAALIYRMLGIDFRGESGGDIVISRCFFSDYYSSDVCDLISSLDEGLLVGLAGGGTLRFSQRITDGHECCRARLKMGEEPA